MQNIRTKLAGGSYSRALGELVDSYRAGLRHDIPFAGAAAVFVFSAGIASRYLREIEEAIRFGDLPNPARLSLPVQAVLGSQKARLHLLASLAALRIYRALIDQLDA